MKQLRYRLDLQFFAQEKTEAATPKKRQEARKKGQVAKSAELPGAFILFFGFLSFFLFGSFYKQHISGLFTMVFNNYLLTELTQGSVTSLFGRLAREGLIMLAPIFLTTFVIAIMGNYLQIGLLFTAEPLMMKFSKLNPLEGAKRIFGMRTVVDFLKSMLKVIIVGAVVYMTLMGAKDQFFQLARKPIEGTFQLVGSLTLKLGIEIGIILIVLALFDYFYQRYEYEKNLRMSKQDIKDEYKKTEGDPLIKSKIRERQRKMAMQRMMQEVPKADVVITNPTHYAVALQYVAGKMDAPRVIAKGTDYVALKIREVAKHHGVVTMENRPLARALYDQVEIGEAIPGELFQAVAEVLAYVFKLKGRAN